MLIRLRAMILQHGLLLASVWNMPQRSLACCLDDADQLEQLLTTRSQVVARTARVNTRQRNPSHWQLLQNPELLTYGLT